MAHRPCFLDVTFSSTEFYLNYTVESILFVGANVLDYQNFDGLWDEVLWVTGQLHFIVLRCTSMLYIRGHVNLWVRVTHNILEH